MKQRIILSEKLNAIGDIRREHAPLRSKRFLDTEVVGAAPQGRVNRPDTIDGEFGQQRPFYANDGLPQYASPFSQSTFRPGRSRSRANIHGNAGTIHSVADYQGRERAHAEEPAPYHVNVELGSLSPSRQRSLKEQENDSFCLSRPLESICSLKGRGILQLLCIIGLIVFALHFASTNGSVTKGSRSILYDALPWVFRATNISAQQTRSKALWENHIVLSDDNRILIPETFESRWNVEVAPLLENQLHRIWDELPTMQCSIGERVYAGFSLKESQSLSATVSFEGKCNPDTLTRLCTQQRQVSDLRHLSIDLPSKSSRSSYSVTIAMKRSNRANDVTIDADTMPIDVKGIIQFHLSDSSMIALARYCSDRRHHFSDIIEQKYGGFNKVGVISLYELKRMYALTSRNRRGASYFTELWDADELSRPTFDPMEYSWHSLTKANSKRFKLRRQDSLDEQNDKISFTSSFGHDSVTNDGETGSNASETEIKMEETSTNFTRINGSPRDAVSTSTSSPRNMSKNSQNDVPKVSSPREEDKSETKLIESAPEPRSDGNDEQRETHDEDEALPDIPQEAEDSEDDDDGSTEVQSQDENGERQGNDSLSQNEFLDSRQESTNPEKMDSTTGINPPSRYVAQREENTINTSDSGNKIAMSQLSASGSHPQGETQETENINQERRLPDQGRSSESDHEETQSQSSLIQVRDSDVAPRTPQPHQMPRQGEPTFPRTPTNSLSARSATSPTGNAGIQLDQSQSTNNPQSQQSLPQSTTNGLPSGGAPLHVGSAEPPSESFQPTQIPSRDPTPRQADRSELLARVPSLRIRDRDTRQKGPQSPQTARKNPETHEIETPLQQSPLRTRSGQGQQEHLHPSGDASARVGILPRAHRVVGSLNQLPKLTESQPQIHSRRAIEETRMSRTLAESRAMVSTNNHHQLSGFREASNSRRASSQINTPRSPPSGIGSMTRSA